ncbi:hypothetical protein CC80DRAFT_496291 [Byssothecium circinans]|uniref:Subtilisin-like serine protease n=1 Tax=Byssothecium circinans TaxID=147558 RepID=A0A6A5TEE9_9PLEO|nr:hypothetical protein CC80DRAFT_496291 [Byssothecium circinans]
MAAPGPFPVPFQIKIPKLHDVEEAGVNQNLAELMPASSRFKETFPDLNGQQHLDMDVIKRAEDTIKFLEKELEVPRLNKIHDHLWLAGRPMPPRPLNYQVAASRAITVTEDIHLHLVWESGRIFLKPLPRYLLSSAFWIKNLVCQQPRDNCPCFTNPIVQPGNPVPIANPPCRRRDLYRCAYGLLLSYTALIQYESDYHLAKDQHLLPDGVEWQSWRKLSWELLEHSPQNTVRVNKRYQFGELRVGRLNKIHHARGLLRFRLVELMRGYKFEFATYAQQLEDYLAPILAATAYILLVLTAMQVGLGTDTLRESLPFQRASYGFTVFSIFAPLILVAIVTFTVLLFVPFNYRSTKTYLEKRMAFYADLGH